MWQSLQIDRLLEYDEFFSVDIIMIMPRSSGSEDHLLRMILVTVNDGKK
jgi:hypothetical protein